MGARVRLSCAACLLLVAPSPGSAQGAAPDCNEKQVLLATAQTLAVNYAVNRFDALVKKEEWARTGFDSWSTNLRLGWEWDENAFGTNMFAHPQHGGLYFNAARANCLTFWESVPLTFLGSWTWEYFGETFRPSLNDFVMTSLGGIAIGEVLHRVSASIRDTELQGGARTSRELAAMVFDPVGGLNRLIRGDWKRRAPNPAEHDPGAFAVRFAGGARRIREKGTPARYSPTLLVDLSYGDPFAVARSPYDAFRVTLQVSPGGGGLNLLRSTGRLHGGALNDSTARHRHRWAVAQRFDYVNNPAYRFGEQAFEAGVLSRWAIGTGGFALRSQVMATATALGAIDGLSTGIGERQYDFGPGVGANVELTLERRGIVYATLYNRWRFLRSVSGADADHRVFFSGLSVMAPITRDIGIGAYLSDDQRSSRYPEGARDRRSYLEGRLFVTWMGGSP